MSSYREHGFEPNGVDNHPPVRPFTATQWIGLGLLVLGALAIIVSILGRMRVIPKVLDDPIPFASIMPLAAVLMNMRRQPAPCDPEALSRRRIIIMLALILVVAGAVLAILIAKGR